MKTITLEQAVELKNIGIMQRSMFFYTSPNMIEITDGIIDESKEKISAFTIDELINILPKDICLLKDLEKGNDAVGEWVFLSMRQWHRKSGNYWSVGYINDRGYDSIYTTGSDLKSFNDSLLNALVNLVVLLHEEKELNVEVYDDWLGK